MINFHKNIKESIFIIFFALTLWSNTAIGASQVLTLNENRRLEANIALDVMNRLTVTQDRITNIFGDDGTFVVQTDEHTGQIFIKPTAENASNPLSITLITENGLTQDLTLHPMEEKAATIILKPSQNRSTKSPEEVLLPGFSRNADNEQELWIKTLRQAVLGELPEFQMKYLLKPRKVAGFELRHQKTFHTGSLVVNLYTIKNLKNLPVACLEKHFYQPGDIALSLQKNKLQPNEKICLYILGHT